MTSASRIAFIGAGNMARALIGGLIGADHPTGLLFAADPDADQRRRVAEEHGIHVAADNREVADSDVLVLAVKPQVIDRVLTGLAGTVDPQRTLVISIAAGIPLGRLAAGLPPDTPLVRAMPNTPALYGWGITALVSNASVTDAARDAATGILAAAGEVVWLDDEALMDAVTAVSGSGPAYFFALTEALAAAGARHGLPADVAQRLATRTAAGAGVMLVESGLDPSQLRCQVTSPGGTTEAALNALTNGGHERLIDAAVDAAVRRSHELGGD